MSYVFSDMDWRDWLFVVVKYAVYGVLVYNGYQFYAAESQAQMTTFAEGLSLAELTNVYSATIDTTFWIMLVALLELETYVIDDDVLEKPAVKWTMLGLRSLCYAMIVYALWGYIVKWLFQADIDPVAAASACQLVGQSYSIMLEFETYVPLAAENCGTLAGESLGQLGENKIIAPMDDLIYARNVAFIDVVNASAWLGVVAILEVDVWNQLEGTYTGLLYNASTVAKVLLYATLFGCAFAWGYTGVWLDIVDAVLWLFAFFFIELNLIQWHQETEDEAAASDAARAV